MEYFKERGKLFEMKKFFKTECKDSLFLFFNYMVWVGRVIINNIKGRTGDKKVPQLKENDSLVILCNGPSLNDTIEKIKGYKKVDYMCLNYFPSNSQYYYELKPKYFCVIDSDYLDPQNSIYSPKTKYLMECLKKSDWKQIIFTYPFHKLKLKKDNLYEFSINCNVHDIDYFSKLEGKRYKKNISILPIKNVAIFALYSAIMLNYKKIYFAGLDMSFHTSIHVNENNHIIQRMEHFYGTEERDLTDESKEIEKEGMSGLFYEWYVDFKGFKIMRDYANSLNIKIINLNRMSFVDCFEKGDL